MDEVFVIVNPAADNGRARAAWAKAAGPFAAAKVPIRVAFTEWIGHATTLAHDAGENGFSTLLFVGGDGTMNEVVNGLLSLPPARRPALAALPWGTGADLPRGLGLKPGPEAAVARLLRRHLQAIDVAAAVFRGRDLLPTSRFFANIADVGLGGRVAERVNRRNKAAGGFASFLEAILTSFWSYEKPELTVRVDDVLRHQGRVASVVMANGCYFAGGMRIAPQARFSDGLLDVVVIGDVGRGDLIANLPRLYRGTHMNHPKVSAFRGRHLVVEGEAPLEMDGESPGWSPVEVRIEPDALRILV
jgi:diacylglycerol kinase (ATP)